MAGNCWYSGRQELIMVPAVSSHAINDRKLLVHLEFEIKLEPLLSPCPATATPAALF